MASAAPARVMRSTMGPRLGKDGVEGTEALWMIRAMPG